ncbi:hypothetical protein RB195_012441 [Necator americanus]|uniref:SHSP domain-containing protein n=1 Tax=Necator americanus TaxID=51031 RepID=A0ABR1D8L9_NECAM
MELWHVPRMMSHMMNEMMRGFGRFDPSIYPYWRDADHSVLHVANETQQVVNDDKKFAVSVDVSQFHPGELNVHLEGHDLVIEGKQEHKSENGYMQRAFIRKWTLPEGVDLEGVRTQLNDKDHKVCERDTARHHANECDKACLLSPIEDYYHGEFHLFTLIEFTNPATIQ